ncbi:beta-ketoacyl-[acyl-carrier-protein] synthase family protein [Endomicrobium proavitum]|uniref:Beta-ketoacyl synthase n=1 Tax=Endomicrobium proavitum TaxID=1408281 RepID=A0A0G3WJ23_9BACT|nr:beta-ketoacyl-[acyl-carrier-protein] synthase family protein [Endomicrobium proavitum]AKL98328.1 Beta-ketoacyl synthase [Endomicrobium proavitum]
MSVNAYSRRVVITGVGAVSPYGAGASLLAQNMLAGKSSVKFNEELVKISEITSKVSSTIEDIDFSYIPRHFRRSMSKMSLFAAVAVKEALKSAGFENAPENTSLFLGSTISSMQAWIDFVNKYNNNEFDTVKTTAIFQVMNHSPLANIAQAFNIKGPGFGTSTACATGLANAGLAYLAVATGLVENALCGGTDEYHPIMTACFAIMNAASNMFNNTPQKASRPFDSARCGIVCGEGCGMLFVESLESALKRNVKIYGEIIGFGTNTETKSISHPSKECISECMQIALKSASLNASDIDFINAHATSTLAGDVEESKAINAVFGSKVPVNSLKGHIGHTMAASGTLELIAMLDMVHQNKIAATLNLENIDKECSNVNHLVKNANLKISTFVKNSFALGGTNCSLIVRRYE